MRLIALIAAATTLVAMPSDAFGKRWKGPLPEMVPEARQATEIRVDKSDRRLDLVRNGEVFASYKIRLGGKAEGKKQFEGDERTPTGSYRIDWKKGDSDYYLGLHISYPNDEDKEFARSRGKNPGGAVFVHGGNNAFRPFDWTDGCIAVRNQEIVEIWRHVGQGTPIHVSE